MDLLRKFTVLPSREKRCLLRAFFMLFYCRILLKTSALQTILTSVYKRSENVQLKGVDSPIAPERISRLIVAASRFVPAATCLPQALVGKILFAENGYITQLHIGVYKDCDSQFEAHAWLSLNDKVILGYLPDLNRFTEMFPSSLQDNQ